MLPNTFLHSRFITSLPPLVQHCSSWPASDFQEIKSTSGILPLYREFWPRNLEHSHSNWTSSTSSSLQKSFEIQCWRADKSDFFKLLLCYREMDSLVTEPHRLFFFFMCNKSLASVRHASKFQRSIRCLNRWTLNHWPKFSALISAFWKSQSCLVISSHRLWSDLPVSSPFPPAHMMWPWWEAASWAWPRPGSSSCGTRRSASSCWRRRKSWVGWAWEAVVVVKEHKMVSRSRDCMSVEFQA